MRLGDSARDSTAPKDSARANTQSCVLVALGSILKKVLSYEKRWTEEGSLNDGQSLYITYILKNQR